MQGNFGLLFIVLWPLVASFCSYGIGRKNKRLRDYFANFATVLEFVVVIVLAASASNTAPPTFIWEGFAGFRIYFKLDGFRCVYAVITAFMWMMTTIFSREYFAHYHNRNRYYFFMMLTLCGTMGVFLSCDLMTTFVFFEVMSFTSYVMVIHDEKPAAQEAAKTYMAVAVLGGLVMLMGIFLTYSYLGTTDMDKLMAAADNLPTKAILFLPAALMLFGFGGKAGMYPLHIWLPNAHPVAPAPASALLSGVLTKTGVFGIIVLSINLFFHDTTWGMVMLFIGVITMFTGAFLAVFSVDLKRTLACSSMSQIGFILVGVAMQGILGHHNALAVRGTLLHMVNHSMIKLVLFMVAGVVYMNVHELNLNKIRGFAKGKPIIIFAFAMGVLAIIGMPMWNGYISKTLLHESIVEQIWLYPDYTTGARFFQVVESIFTLTGGLTAAYMVKIFVAVCIEKNADEKVADKFKSLNGRYMNSTSAIVIFTSAIILPILGMFPNVNHVMMEGIGKFGQAFMHGEDPAHAVEFLAWINLKGALASLSIGAIVYVLIVRNCLMKKTEDGKTEYINVWPEFIDIEKKIYRPLLLKILPFIGALFARTIGSIVSGISALGFRLSLIFKAFWTRFTEKLSKNHFFQKFKIDWNKNIGEPIVNMDSVRAKSVANGAKWNSATQRVWEGEGDWLEGIEEARQADLKVIYESAPLEDHGHDSHTENKEESNPIRWIISWFVKEYHKLLGKSLDNSLETNDKDSWLRRTIMRSLSYSLLLFLLGLVIILAVVVFR